MNTSHSLLLLSLVVSAVVPPAALSQIASPSNAGQNSGNNTSGSSSTPIGTPNFSPVTAVSNSTGVTVAADGSVNASPAIVTAVDTAIVSVVATEQASILSQVVTATAPAPLTGPESLVPDVTVGVLGVGTPELVSLSQLPSKVVPLDQLGQTITVSRPSSGASGTIQIADGSLTITALGQSVSLPTSTASQVQVLEFAAVAIAIGLTPPSISLGSQLISAGITAQQTLSLMSSLQGLSNQVTLTSLSSGITSFNAIVDSASPAVLSSLAENPVFAAASVTLREARVALSGAS